MRYISFLAVVTILVTAFIIMPFLSHAQVPDPGNPDAPIDGGVSILIAAAVGYGVKRVRGRSGGFKSQG